MKSNLYKKDLISAKFAGELSGYSSRYLRRLAGSGEIEGVQVGRVWMVKRGSLVRFMDAQSKRKEELSKVRAQVHAAEYHGHRGRRKEKNPSDGNFQFSIHNFQSIFNAQKERPNVQKARVPSLMLGVIVFVVGSLFVQGVIAPQLAKIEIQPAAVAVAESGLSIGEGIALATYETLNGWFSSATRSLASLFAPTSAPTATGSLTSNAVPRSQTSPVAVATSTPPTTTASPKTPAFTAPKPATIVAGPSYPTYVTNLNGVSVADVKQLLATERSTLLATVSGMIQPVAAQGVTNMTTIQQVNMIEDLSNLIVRNGDFRGGSFTGGSLSDGIYVGATTGVFGNLTVDSTTLGTLAAGQTTLATTTVMGDLTITGSTQLTSLIAGGLSTLTNGFLSLASSTITSGLFTMSGGASTTNLTASGTGYFGTLGIGTTSPDALLALQQTVNGVPILSAYRMTDAAPSGDFINYKTKGGTTLFRVDNSGNLLAGGIINSGSQTITSIATPQFRVQYDASNEITLSTNTTGTTTIGVNGAAPGLVFTPQSNLVNTFNFTDAASDSVLSIDTVNKRVGIGTTGPGEKLQVGDYAIEANNYLKIVAAGTINPYVGIKLKSYSDYYGFTMQYDSSLLGLNILRHNADSNGTSAMFIQRNTGNVGVGSTTPWGLLSVNPNGITGPAFVVGSSTATNFIVTNGGNVGIGTAGPGSTLHVVGSSNLGGLVIDSSGDFSKLTGAYRFNNGGINLVTGGATIAANNITSSYGVASASLLSTGSGSQLVITPLSTQTINQTIWKNTAGAATTVVDPSGNVGIGTTTPWAKLSVAGSSLDSTTPLFSISSSTPTATTTVFHITSQGNVGIGTNAPAAQLQVNHTKDASGQALYLYQPTAGWGSTAVFDAYRFIQTNVAQTDGQFKAFHVGAGGVAIGYSATPSYNSADALYVSGNVGIGTAVPFNKLHITGSVGGGAALNAGVGTSQDVLIDGAAAAMGSPANVTIVANSSTSIDSGGSIAFGSKHIADNNGSWAQLAVIKAGKANSVGGDYGGYLAFGTRTNGATTAERMRIDTNGNVGVGSTTPWGLLSVNPTAAIGSAPQFVVGSSTATNFIVTNGGNVGIGTASPGTTLDVNGIGRFTGGLRMNGSGINQFLSLNTAESAYGEFRLSASKIDFAISGVDKMVLLNNGNVGIGTTSPFAKLSVQTTAGGTTPLFTIASSTNGTGTSTAFIVTSNGNVGIGTAAPTTMLNVVAPSGSDGLLLSTYNSAYNRSFAKFTNQYDGSTVMNVTNPSANEGAITLGAASGGARITSSGGTAVSSYYRASQGLWLGGGDGVWGIKGGRSNYYLDLIAGDSSETRMTINKGSGNVSIGGIDPSSGVRLLVKGGGATSATSALNVTDSSNTSLLFVRDDGNVGVGSTTPWGQLSVNPNGIAGPAFVVGSSTATNFIVTNGGNVGIGTAGPSTKLDVNGNGAFGAGGAGNRITLGYTAGSNPPSSGDGIGFWALGSGNSWLQGYSTMHISAQGSPLLLNETGGNVGVGSTTPWGLLSVNPNGITGPAFVVGSSTATNFIVTNGGNVGIGTNSPNASSNLDIVGAYGVNVPINNAGYHFNGNTQWGLSSIIGTNDITLGAYSNLIFKTYNGSAYSEVMRITGNGATGNVGIGTTTPSQKLTIDGSILFSSTTPANKIMTSSIGGVGLRIQFPDNGADNADGVVIGSTSGDQFRVSSRAVTLGSLTQTLKSDAIGATGQTFIDLGSTAVSYKGGGINPGSLYLPTSGTDAVLSAGVSSALQIAFHANNTIPQGLRLAGLTAGGSQTYGTNIERLLFRSDAIDSASAIAFELDTTNTLSTAGAKLLSIKSAGNEKFTVMQTGNVGIGTTSPATLFEVGGATANVTFGGYKNCTGFTSNADGLLACTASDERLKQGIASLTDTGGLAAINALRPVSFTWRDPTLGTAEQFGFIAQEMQSVFPNLVQVTNPTVLSPDGTLTINYLGLISPMIRSIQELDAKFNQHASSTAITLTSLETRLAALESGAVSMATSSPISLASTTAQFVAWFADAGNGIGEFFANRVHTKELCVQKADGSEFCANGDQLAAMAAAASVTVDGTTQDTTIQVVDPVASATPVLLDAATSTAMTGDGGEATSSPIVITPVLDTTATQEEPLVITEVDTSVVQTIDTADTPIDTATTTP